MRLRTAILVSLVTGVLLLAVACKSKGDSSPAIGEAYTGPASLGLRSELSLQSPLVANVPHGQRVEIIQVRRRFVRVRTSSGIEGWTDSRQLLTTEQMMRLRRLTEAAAGLPSQGWAAIVDPLNLHTEPNRYSPSFFLIPENTVVTVIGHTVSERAAPKGAASVLPKPAPRKPRKSRDKEKDKEKSRIAHVPPPPMPAAPKPPENWLELSKTNEPPEAEKEPEEEPATPAKVLPKDDWTLVRTKEGRVGWVLTRPLSMGIPDDVAQYAEGHHISSFFSLGDVQDESGPKHNWLWTTIRQLGESYEFDGFRVFTWNPIRHRYETAYRERDLKGYFPVRVHAAEVTENRKQVKGLGFSIIVEDSEGHGWLRNYAFLQNHVRFLGKEPIEISRPSPDAAAPVVQATRTGEPAAPQPGGWRERLREWKSKIWK